MQDLVLKLPGVISTRVGHTGGDVPNATHRRRGTHAAAIEIWFDPSNAPNGIARGSEGVIRSMRSVFRGPAKQTGQVRCTVLQAVANQPIRVRLDP